MGLAVGAPCMAHAQDAPPPPDGPPPAPQVQQADPQQQQQPKANQQQSQQPPAQQQLQQENQPTPQVDANGDYILPPDNGAPAQPQAATPATLDQANQQALAGLKDGGTIRGHVTAGAQNGKGGVALPGVAITATNSLTGDKYSTVTDVTGAYGLAIPKNGRYVVRAELAAFAAGTKEIVLNAQSRQGVADIGMELASRVQDNSSGSQFAGAMNFGGRGTQSLGLNSAAGGALAAGFGGQQESSLPTIGGADAGDSVAVSGASGSTSASFNFEQARQGFEDQRALQGVSGGGGQGGPGGQGGGPGGGGNMGFAMGGPPPGGGGRSMFRNFKPNAPHGSLVLQATNSALNAQDYSLDGTQQAKPDYGSERYGAVYVGPLIPGVLTSTKNFLFLSAFGNHGSSPFDEYGLVPTVEERTGLVPVESVTNGQGNPIVACSGSTSGQCYQFPVTPFAAAYLQGSNPLIPLPNQTADSSNRNYRVLTSTTTNTDTLGARFTHNFGSAGGGGMPPWMRGSQSNSSLTQNLNINFNYNHTGSDLLTLFPDFRGKEQIHQISGTLGYSIGKGRWLWNLSTNINRTTSDIVNPYTNTTNIAQTLGVQGAGLVPFFYGLPSVNFAGSVTSANETQASNRTNQVLTLSDSTSWSKGSHNVRFGGDAKRIELNLQGGVNGTGAFTFSGFATGSDLGDFLLGYPQIANLQSGGVNDVQKFYFRANVFDAFLQDSWRVSPKVTVLAGLRYEYFSPYSEKYDHIANLDPNANFTSVDVVLPYETGPNNGPYPRALVDSSTSNFAPRFGLAWKALKNTVVRAGYGVNYNTAQYGAFIQRLGYQPPFATAVNNSQSAPVFTVYDGLTANASSTTCTVFPCITNNFAVDKNYRLGYVQVYNLDIQQTLPKGFVLNVGYNGSKGTHLDGLLAPNYVLNVGSSTPNAEVFNYEVSSGLSNYNALAVRLRKRFQNNLSLGVTYTYSHSIDDASSVGAGTQIVAQLPQSLEGDRGNSSYDQRHIAVGDWLYQLPFGPNQHYLTSGNWVSHAISGLQWSGSFTFSTGTPLNPYYAASVAQGAAGVSGSLRPDRIEGSSLQPPAGASQLNEWFNVGAFSEPCANTTTVDACHFGDAARNSIFGPGTTDIDMAFSKVVQFGDTKTLEFRAQGTNIFNIVQYATVDSNLTSGTVGHVLSARAMREFVLLARFRF